MIIIVNNYLKVNMFNIIDTRLIANNNVKIILHVYNNYTNAIFKRLSQSHTNIGKINN